MTAVEVAQDRAELLRDQARRRLERLEAIRERHGDQARVTAQHVDRAREVLRALERVPPDPAPKSATVAQLPERPEPPEPVRAAATDRRVGAFRANPITPLRRPVRLRGDGGLVRVVGFDSTIGPPEWLLPFIEQEAA